jgi:WS/DGAT/MGAT family acyltransferase
MMTVARLIKEPLSPVDSAWLRIGTPTNLAMINGVITFSEALDYERLVATFEARLVPYKRFRQRVIEPLIGPPYWEMDANFDIHNHVYKISLPEPRDHEALQNLASEMMSMPLEINKPLWELHYVDNYSEGGALICRLHHCIADGVALIRVLLSTADVEPNAAWPEPREELYSGSGFSGLSPLARLFVPAVKTIRAVQNQWRGARHLLNEGFDTLFDRGKMLALTRKGADGSMALGKLVLMLPDRRTILKGQCGIPKRAVWSKAIKVEDVKMVGKTTGGTINDILLTAMTGALRRYMLDREQVLDGLNIRVIVPVDLRTDADFDRLGNRFGLVFLSLPVGVEDPKKRLAVLKRRMDAIKDTPEAVVSFGILAFMGINPRRIENIIRNIFGLKGTAVMTNVPGPRQPLYMAGGRIDGLMFWVPTPANVSLGVSIISYAGEVIVGVATDAGIIPDPERIVDAFQDEFETLRNLGGAPDQVEAPAEYTVSEEAGNCHAMTKKGAPCKNRALAGSAYCRVHSTHG